MASGLDEKLFPCFLFGPVIQGFKRGSKEIGFPTANYPEDIVEKLPSDFVHGVYYGWAQVNDGPVYKMVMSIGDNPFYRNEKKTIVRIMKCYAVFLQSFWSILLLKETYIMHKFSSDFYGSCLKVVVLGYLRPMLSYENLGKYDYVFSLRLHLLSIVLCLDKLIDAIRNDVEVATKLLDLNENLNYKSNSFFSHNLESKL